MGPKRYIPHSLRGPGRVFCIYVDDRVLSGQRRASELMIAELEKLGWECVRLPMPSLERRGNFLRSLLSFSYQVLAAWLGATRRFWSQAGVLHVNLGQSMPALIREGTPLLIYWLLHGSRMTVISMHGSWFMGWRKHDARAILLRFLARRAGRISILGPDQADKLESFGVERWRIKIVDNTCELPPFTGEKVREKHNGNRRASVLFLSHLVDTKGYPEFLAAIEIYASRPELPPLNAVLCGPLIDVSHATRLRDYAAAKSFVLEKIAAIRRSGHVTIEWINEAEGVAKERLFAQANIFVFPSRLEAQPLVLIEAMASGCAIITSQVGQIPRMLQNDSGVLLARPTAENVVAALIELVQNTSFRTEMATRALANFEQFFTRRRYGERWQSILESLSQPDPVQPTEVAAPVWFSYADTPWFSGQKEISRMIADATLRVGRPVRMIALPAYSRDEAAPLAIVSYLLQTVRAFAATTRAVFSSEPILHVALGQTRLALFRDGLPLFIIVGWRREKRAVISLNGSNFMAWRPGSIGARMMRLLARNCTYITIVGTSQKAKLHSLGVPESKLLVVPNSSSFVAIPEEEVQRKHRSEGPLKVLHLSTLIDTKGYTAFLEALEIMSRKSGRRIEAVLCGNVTMSAFGERFTSVVDAEKWIREIVAKINLSTRVEVTWVEGAWGEAKLRRFRDAALFVFPTRYRVEAQPLVLLEAMAAGCAIITSAAGEIRETLGDGAGVILDNPGPADVADALESLARTSDRAAAMAQNARRRYISEYSPARFEERWSKIFSDLDPATGETKGADSETARSARVAKQSDKPCAS